MSEILMSVSPVEPAYNKKGKQVGWKFSAKYMVASPEDRPSKLCFYSTRVQEYSFYNLFGLGYNLAQKSWTKKVSQLAEQIKDKINENIK